MPCPSPKLGSRTRTSPSAAQTAAARAPADHQQPPSPLTIRPYRAADLDTLILQPAQSHAQAQLQGRGYAQILSLCEAWTFALPEQSQPAPQEGFLRGVPQGPALPGERILACIGLIPFHPRRALAWGLITGDCGKHFAAIHRAARRYLRVTPYTRIEAHVEAGFANGERWMRLLGFENETPQGMRAYSPEGRTCHLYAWLAPGVSSSSS